MTAYNLKGSANLAETRLNEAGKDADQMLAIDPSFAPGYILKSNIFVALFGQKVTSGSNTKAEIKYFEDAIDILKKGAENCAGKSAKEQIASELEDIELFYVHFSKGVPNANVVPEPDPSITPMKMISKPRPGYTDSARQSNLQGTIVASVLFGANGKVVRVLLLKKLGGGLDEQALRAAYGIKFEPVKKDGIPISVVKMVEYSFSIY